MVFIKMVFFKKNANFVSDHKKRCDFKNGEFLTVISSGLSQSKITKSLYCLFLHRSFISKPFTIIKNRCIFTLTSKSVFSKLKMSRIFFKKKALMGEMPGYYRAVW